MCFVGYNHSHVLKVCADQGICTEHEDIPEHCDASKFISTALECLAQGDREKARVFETLNFCEKG